MAGVAGDSAGVIRGRDLGESFRLGAVGLMAAGTDDGRVQLGRCNRCGIVGVLGEGSMASLAGDDHMLAQFLLIDDIGMTGLAGIVPGMGDRPSGNFGDRGSAVVPVLSKTGRDDGSAQHGKCQQRDNHDGSETDEVFRVFEQVRIPAPNFGRVLRSKLRNILGYCVFLPRTMIEVTGVCDMGHDERPRTGVTGITIAMGRQCWQSG